MSVVMSLHAVDVPLSNIAKECIETGQAIAVKSNVFQMNGLCVCAWCMLRFMDASSFVINITDHPASNFVYISRKLPLQDVDIDAAATAHTCIAMVLCCDWLWCVFRV